MGFYEGKRVLITGHTGFKGSWLCEILLGKGALVTGYSTESPTKPNLYEALELSERMHSVIGDIRDMEKLARVFRDIKPEIVFHLAAQPIVLDSYKNPVYTYETNVMGTVNLLECIRQTDSVKSVVNITTDKVYQNNEWVWGYRENDRLCGHDPYSNSKSCSELVTYSYKHSFFCERDIAISTARAGNVIGGGDFSPDRIIPDCIRAMEQNKKIIVRNPNSTRPYQHVLEPLFMYMDIAEKQYRDKKYEGNFNIGPDECDCIRTGELVDLFCEKWGNEAMWEAIEKNGPHEANFLKLDCSKVKHDYGWKPTWHVDKAIENTVEWTKAYLSGKDIRSITDEQIKSFILNRSKEEGRILV